MIVNEKVNDYQLFSKMYNSSADFKNRDGGDYADLLKKVQHSGWSYEIYYNTTDNGCTLFYDDPSKRSSNRSISKKSTENNLIKDYERYCKVSLNFLSSNQYYIIGASASIVNKTKSFNKSKGTNYTVTFDRYKDVYILNT